MKLLNDPIATFATVVAAVIVGELVAKAVWYAFVLDKLIP